ncbi:MAG: HemY protein [Arenicella sp.]|jgi:HemY protein
MRLVVLLILASVLGYGVFQLDKIDPDNYVKMYIGHYVIEVKVLGFLILVFATAVVIYFLLWLLRSIWRSPKTLSHWRDGRNRDKADSQFGAGYMSLLKGDWQRAEKQLTARSDYSHIPYVNFLAAARAAQEQGRMEQRDIYLNAAYQAAPQERLAIGLSKAKLHEKAGQIEQALATLEDVSSIGHKNPQYTAMLLQVHQSTENWQGVQDLLSTAKKQKALSAEVLEKLQDDLYRNSLAVAQDKNTAWKALPHEQRKQIQNIELYVKSLVLSGDVAGAEKLIRSTLSDDWSDALVRIYGQLQAEKPEKLLRKAEGWLHARPENPELNLAAGRLAAASNEPESAKQYLQAAISLGRLPAAYALLGEVFEADGDNAKALQMYRVGIQALVTADEAAAAKLGHSHQQESSAKRRPSANRQKPSVSDNKSTLAVVTKP